MGRHTFILKNSVTQQTKRLTDKGGGPRRAPLGAGLTHSDRLRYVNNTHSLRAAVPHCGASVEEDGIQDFLSCGELKSDRYALQV